MVAELRSGTYSRRAFPLFVVAHRAWTLVSMGIALLSHSRLKSPHTHWALSASIPYLKSCQSRTAVADFVVLSALPSLLFPMLLRQERRCFVLLL